MSIGSIAQGATLQIPLRVVMADGVTPSVDFLPTDTLAVAIWPGDDRAPVSTPVAAWDPANGPPDYSIQLAPADTLAVEPGTYKVRVTATRGPDSPEILRDTIEILAAPGVAVSRPVYCTFEDMTDVCSWIGQYLDTSEDQAGFLAQRAEAREWMDGLILKASPTGFAGVTSRQSYWTWSGGTSDPWAGRGLAADRKLAEYLAADYLVIAGPIGAPVVRACANYAVARVFGSMPDPNLLRFAGLFMRKAQNEAATMVAELDINGDGTSEYAIVLSSTNTRYG